jgi:hypothetical protein
MVLYAGISDGDYKSFVYDSSQKSSILVDALSGIQVYQAISSGQVVFINGLDLSKNQISNFVLDVENLQVKAEVENSSQVLALETVDYSPSEP